MQTSKHNPSAPENVHKSSFFARLRNYFLTGLVIAAPVGITVYLVRWFIDLVDYWVLPWIPEAYRPDQIMPFYIPGIGLLIAFIMLTLLGALTANFFGRRLLFIGERFVDRMPVVRTVYNGLKQIFETVISQNNSSFQQVGLIEYPRRGLYALVFLTTETKGEVLEKTAGKSGENFSSVFLPTTPNPTSGFLLFVPNKEIRLLDMSVEEGAKLVISAGLITPDMHAESATDPEGNNPAVKLANPIADT